MLIELFTCRIFLDDKDLEAFLDLPVAEKISRETRPFRIVVAVQCLHRLQKLPDAIEVKEWSQCTTS